MEAETTSGVGVSVAYNDNPYEPVQPVCRPLDGVLNYLPGTARPTALGCQQ